MNPLFALSIAIILVIFAYTAGYVVERLLGRKANNKLNKSS